MRLILVLVPVLASGAASAAIPNLISHEGRILRADGAAERGSVEVTFALYASSSGGAALWSETKAVALSNTGYYATMLGSAVTLPALDGPLWLGITIQGESEMTPRARIATVPFALRAAMADDTARVGGGPASEVLRTTSDLDAARLTVGRLSSSVMPTDVPVMGTNNTGNLSVTGTGTFGLLSFSAPVAGTPGCSSSNAGQVYYDAVERVFLGCDGSQWTAVGGIPVGTRASRPGLSCKDIKTRGPYLPDGLYWIDPDGSAGLPLTVVMCDMTRDGGGWTLGIKNWYGSGVHGVPTEYGHLGDALVTKGSGYKLSDNVIRAVIGAGNNFDVMGDQAGFQSAQSNGNYEYVVLRNYTTPNFRFDALVPESSTTTTMQSYRIADQALAWTGRLGCGYAGGVGINCYPLQAGSSPNGGGGCSINMGKVTGDMHHFFMSETNADTYLYICNGSQHSSGYNMNHRWWFRAR